MESSKFLFVPHLEVVGFLGKIGEPWGRLEESPPLPPRLRILMVLRWIWRFVDFVDHFLTMKHVPCGGRQLAAGTTNPQNWWVLGP